MTIARVPQSKFFYGGVAILHGTEWNGSSIKCGTGSIKHGMEVFEHLPRSI